MNQTANTNVQAWPYADGPLVGPKIYGVELWNLVAEVLKGGALTDDEKKSAIKVELENDDEGTTSFIKFQVPVTIGAGRAEDVDFEIIYLQPRDVGAKHCELLRFVMTAGRDTIVDLNTEDSVVFDFNDTVAVGDTEEKKRLKTALAVFEHRGDFDAESKTCLQILAIGLATFA